MTGFDLNSALLARAQSRSLPAGMRVQLHRAYITTASSPSGTFDAFVSSFTLCVLPPEQRGPPLAETAHRCRSGRDLRPME
ncbi:class I SAM-dependent methyltransferase [Aquisalimonas lutea]|uniref:class I SAM-dependent methyltransferase n=1 Tax=Aquisalimonas lutea TaxID=1327750 RepID=UPI00338E090F